MWDSNWRLPSDRQLSVLNGSWGNRPMSIILKPFLVFPVCKTVPIEINIPARHDISNDSNVDNPKSKIRISHYKPDSWLKDPKSRNSWYYKRPAVISGRLNSEPGWTMLIRPVWVPEHRELHSQDSSWFKLLHVIFLQFSRLFPCMQRDC